MIWGNRGDVDCGLHDSHSSNSVSAAVAHLLPPPLRLPPQAGELLLERPEFLKRRAFRPSHFLPCTQLFCPHAQKLC